MAGHREGGVGQEAGQATSGVRLDGQGGQHGLGGQWVQLGQENRTSSLWETTRSFVTESLTIRYLGRCHFRLKMLLKNFVLKNTEPES